MTERQKLGTIAELEALPDGAVIYDHNNRVWQHGIADLSSGQVNLSTGTGAWKTTQLWVTFATYRVEYTKNIALPAWLLDDGR